MARNAIRVLNDQLARQAVIRNYAQWYEWHVEQEQFARDGESPEIESLHHDAVLSLRWALDAEQVNTKPEGLR